MAGNIARAKVERSLRHKARTAIDRSYQPRDEVLVWREKQVESRIGEWLGPYFSVIFDTTSKILVSKKDEKSALERYNTTRVKPFLRPQEAASAFLDVSHMSFAIYTNLDDNNVDSQSPLQKHCLGTTYGKRSSDNQKNPEITTSSIQVTEIIDKDDPRASSVEMRRAVMSQMRDLLKRGTFKIMLDEELRDWANALTARFVLAIKSNADGEIKYKARYVIGDHRD